MDMPSSDSLPQYAAEADGDSYDEVFIAPASFDQEWLWFLDQLEPGNTAYNNIVLAEITGILSPETVEQCIREISRRHEILRTTFSTQDGQPIQVIALESEFRIHYVDVYQIPEDQTRQIVDEAAVHAFDLTKGPLFQVAIFRLSVRTHLLAMIRHHIIFDGWSDRLFLEELQTLYHYFAGGTSSNLSELAIQYADYAQFQRAYLTQEVLTREISFWRGKLRDATPLIELPLDRQRPPVKTFNGDRKRTLISQSASAGISAIAQVKGATLFMVLTAIFKLLLFRYTGQTDILIGSPSSTRDRKEVERLLGCFVNTIALRTDLSGNPTFEELLGRVRDSCLEAYAHRYLPFQKLVQALQPQRSSGYQPFLQVILGLIGDPAKERVLMKGLTLRPLRVSQKVAMSELELSIMETELGLVIDAEFNTDLFETPIIERLLRHFQNLTEGVIEDPQMRISEFRLLGDTELAQLLVQWNDSQDCAYDDSTLHGLFQDQVARTPDSIACGSYGTQISYSELSERTNHIARFFIEKGLEPEQVVALLVDRSSNYLILIMAVLQAGGAFLPLDPREPASRLGKMLEVSRSQMIVVEDRYVALISEAVSMVGEPVEPVIVPLTEAFIARRARHHLPPVTTPNNLAYVMFTSGSTGIPKGAMIERSGMLNHIRAKIAALELNSGDVLAQNSPPSFDIIVWQFLAPVMVGGRVCVLKDDIASNPVSLLYGIDRESITILQLVPSLLKHVVKEAMLRDHSRPHLSSLRCIVPTGEALHMDLCRKWFDLYPDIPMLNNCGATECSDDYLHYFITHSVQLTGPSPIAPIGRPILNMSTYVLDGILQPVPIGVSGELHAGGKGLGRGYLDDPVRTAETFLPDPFSESPGARLYKSRDVARYLSNGIIEIRGRTDETVKINGIRIDLGEIEAAIEQHQSIMHGVAAAHEDEHGRKRLAAYFVPKIAPISGPDRTADSGALHSYGDLVSELREFLKRRLPDYLVPTYFMLLESLPLNRNGKVDRNLLPVREWSRPDAEKQYVAPRTPTESVLANIWRDLLGLREVGVFDNFFELGGDSIISIQIIARANEMGLSLSPRQMFVHQTVSELADAADSSNRRSKLEPSQGLEQGAVELTAIQRSFFEQDLEAVNHWNQALILEVRERANVPALNAGISELLVHHDAFRLRFVPYERGWLQRYSGIGEVGSALTEIDLSEIRSSQRVSELERIAGEAQEGLNLSAGPLHRIILFRLSEDEHERLLIIIHHLIVEGFSWRIILDDLQRAYLQAASGKGIKLPPKSDSWKTWARRISEFAKSEEIAEDLEYWRAQIRTSFQPLPVDFEADLNTEGSAGEVEMILSDEYTRLLLGKAHEAYRTQINDLLLASLVPALGEWLGTGPVPIDLVGHGREDVFDDIDVSRTVGWFSSVFPVVLAAEDHMDYARQVKSVKETLRQVPRRGLSYGLLRYSKGDRSISEELGALSPQLCFDYLGQTDAALREDLPFALARESPGPTRDPCASRRYLLEISSIISGAHLKVLWRYSKSVHSFETVCGLATRHIECLRKLIEHCTSGERTAYTPSDFDLVDLTPARLKRIVGDAPNIEDIYPLSSLQQGLMFHSLNSPGTGMYVLQWVLRLSGNPNIPAFQWAWRKVIERHAVLRTAFVWDDDSDPVQVVHRQADEVWKAMDWRSYEPSEQERHLELFLAEDLRKDFQLNEPPLMRLAIIRLAGSGYYFVWTHHHLLIDGWSLAIVLDDVVAAYKSFVEEEAVLTLPDPPLYRDYIAWSLRQDLVKAELYWRKTMEGFDTPLTLNIDGPTNKGGFGECSVKLSISVAERLQSVARARRLTMNTLLQGAWALLLGRYFQRDDVVYGITVSGRPPSLYGVDRMVGLFINTLPVRVRVQPREEWWPWLNDLQQCQTQLQEYEYTPLVDIKKWSEVPPGMPLFESIVVFENFPIDPTLVKRSREKGLEIEVLQVNERTNYPLTLVCSVLSGVDIRISYDLGQFEECTVERIVTHLARLLRSMDSCQYHLVGDLPLLTESEIQQLTIEWNDAEARYQHEICIYDLVEQQANLKPDAVAIVFESEHVGYQQLIYRANCLSRRLVTAFVAGGQSLVGMFLNRSTNTIVAILGILKSGAAYIPLDPSYPEERLLSIMDQTSLVVTTSDLLSKLPKEISPVLLTEDIEAPTVESLGDRFPIRAWEQVAYCMYTSGSTGRPKGVLVEHRNVISLIMNDQLPISISDGDIWTMFHSYCFDFSVWEIFGALFYGGKLVIVPEEATRDPGRFLDLLACEMVTMLNQTPPSFYNLVEEAMRLPRKRFCLRCVIFGGSSLDTNNLKDWKNFYPEIELINMYGITETTIHTSFKVISDDDLARPVCNIGRPLPGTSIYLLGSDLQPVPIGVPGEVFVGGTGVSLGYLNLPEQVADRFIPSPFDVRHGSRLYKTGDLARCLPSGDLDYLGRSDNQVKIRGFRIEIEEVEAALRQHPEVKEAAVIAREDPSGGQMLVGYVVTNNPSGLTNAELRLALNDRLPEYMVPDAFVFLESMPLTRNYKVNRSVLAVLELSSQNARATSDDPQTAAERLLASIWCEVLGLDQLGVNDSFFELGGHSLLAAKLIFRIRDAFAMDLSVSTLYDAPTVSSLLRKISELAGGMDRVEEISLINQQIDKFSQLEIRHMIEALREDN